MPTTTEYKRHVYTLTKEEVDKVLRKHIQSLSFDGALFAAHGVSRPDISYGCTYPSELSSYSFVIEEGKL